MIIFPVKSAIKWFHLMIIKFTWTNINIKQKERSQKMSYLKKKINNKILSNFKNYKTKKKKRKK